MTFLYLFIEFFKIGLFAVGGGPATIPFLYNLANSEYGWFNEEQLTNMIAISESTPGPIGVNMATYAGYNAGYADLGILGGILGGVIATVGLVFPSVVIIIIVAQFLKQFSENKLVKSAFYGIRPIVASILLYAIFGIIRQTFYGANGFNVPVIIMAVCFFALMFQKKLKNLHPAVWFLFGAIIGIILGL